MGGGASATSHEEVGEVELVGRELETDRLRAFVDQATDRGGALLIVGEAGVGKTGLLDDVVGYAEHSDVWVIRSVGAEFEADVSFAALHQLVLPLLDLLPGLTTAHQAALTAALGLDSTALGSEAVVSTAVLELLKSAAEECSLLAVLDDLQWLDRASALTLGFVARRLAGTRIGLIAAARPGEHTFFDRGGIPSLDVEPLTPEAADVLLQQRFPMLAPQVRHRLYDEARGNPLALLELPVALTPPQRAADDALPKVLPLTSRLQAVFSERVLRLPPPTRSLLLLAALDSAGEVSHLQRARGGTALPDLAAAERAQLVNVDSRRVVFRHPLTRAAVVQASTAAERRDAHQRLAEAMHDQPERRAWHLAEAASGPDEHVAMLLESAARHTRSRGDAVGAVAALLRAADLSADGADRGRRLAQAAYLGATATGNLNAIPKLLEAARAARPDPMMGLAETVAVTSHLLNIEAEIDTGHRLLASAVEMIQPPLDALDETVIEALHTLLRICYWGGRPELWAPLDAAFGRLSPAPPELLDLLRATYRDPARDAVAAVSRIDAAIDRLPAVTDPVVVTRVAMCAVYLDRLSACREPLQRVATEARASGAIASAIQAVFLLGNLSWVNGDWSELEGYVAEGLDLCRDNGYELLAWRGGYVEGLRLAACGETASVRELTDRMTRWAGPRRVSLIQSFADHILALDANGRGDFEAAFHHAAKISPPGELAECRPTALTTVFELTEAAVRTGRRAEAVRHVEAAREASLPALSTRLNLLTTGAAALCADASEASTLFEDALGEPGSTSWPFDRARIQLAYGERLRRDKNTTDARLHLSAALDTFRRLGAEPWAARASQELRATGVSVGNPQPSKATELTPQQYEIATLAAQGLTNRQIGERLYLSPRTVSTHLYQLFPKLGVTSRAALADALRGVSTHETS